TPGGISGVGKERSEAFVDFKRCYLAALYDIAAEATDGDDFNRQIRGFFLESSQEAEWLAAVNIVRDANTRLEGLKTVSASSVPPDIQIEVTQNPAPSANSQHEDVLLEAA